MGRRLPSHSVTARPHHACRSGFPSHSLVFPAPGVPEDSRYRPPHGGRGATAQHRPGPAAPRRRRAGRARPAACGLGWARPGGSGGAAAAANARTARGEVLAMAPPATSDIPPTAPSPGPTAAWLGYGSAHGGSLRPRYFATVVAPLEEKLQAGTPRSPPAAPEPPRDSLCRLIGGPRRPLPSVGCLG